MATKKSAKSASSAKKKATKKKATKKAAKKKAVKKKAAKKKTAKKKTAKKKATKKKAAKKKTAKKKAAKKKAAKKKTAKKKTAKKKATKKKATKKKATKKKATKKKAAKKKATKKKAAKKKATKKKATKKKRRARRPKVDVRVKVNPQITLAEMIALDANSNRTSEVTPELERELDKFEDKVHDATEAWCKKNRLPEDKCEEVLDNDALVSDAYLTLAGHGAGFWDGDWDHLLSKTQQESLTRHLEKEVGRFVDDTGAGSLLEAAYVEEVNENPRQWPARPYQQSAMLPTAPEKKRFWKKTAKKVPVMSLRSALGGGTGRAVRSGGQSRLRNALR